MKPQHLVFYDGHCGLCDHIVQLILAADKKKIFAFAPLQGTTAQKLLTNLPKEYKGEDSLVLIENYNSPSPTFYVLGNGALRIAWQLGSFWTPLGLLHFLPAFLYNWIYRIIASQRHKIFKQDICKLPDPNEHNRFLP